MIDTDRSRRNRARPGVRRALVPGLLALWLAAAQSVPAGPIAAPVAKGTVLVRLETVATGLTAPVWGSHAPGDDRHLYLADQDGRMWRVDLQTGEKLVFLDLRARLVRLGLAGPGSFDERGFLGFAFHPGYVLANRTGTPFGDTGVALRLSQPLSFSVQSGSLAVPGIRVASPTGDSFFSAALRQVSSAGPLSFELLHARAIAGPLPAGSPFGDDTTGLFILPRVEVIFGPGDLRAYSASLRSVPGTRPPRVEVVEAQLLGP